MKEELSLSPSAEGLRKYFSREGITHIAMRKDLFTAFAEANFPPLEKKAFMEFRRQNLNLLFESKGYQLYEIKGG